MASNDSTGRRPSISKEELEDGGTLSVKHESHASEALPSARREPPEILRHLTVEERAAVERRLVRKIDLRLLPMLVLMYLLNYLDRNNIASARVQGLQADLGMSDVQYQVSGLAGGEVIPVTLKPLEDRHQHPICRICLDAVLVPSRRSTAKLRSSVQCRRTCSSTRSAGRRCISRR